MATQLSIWSYRGHKIAAVTRCVLPCPRTSIVRGNCVRETSVKRRNKIVQEITRNVANVLSFCPPPFRKKAEGHCFWLSVARGAWFRIFSRYLVPLTRPTVFVRSFWNFTGALRMVWRYACGFFRILKLFFITFFTFWTDIFWVLILQKCIGSRYLVPLTPPKFLADPFETLHGLLE